MTQEDITEATKLCMSAGESIFQIFRFGTTNEDHVAELLTWMNPPQGAKILDVGCGAGTVAKIMKDFRPYLSFTLLNNNPYQISLCPQDMQVINADMHDTGLPDNSFDVVMVNYAIGYADLNKVFTEFNRLLKDGGILFICDMIGENELTLPVLGYRTEQVGALAEIGEKNGFVLDTWTIPAKTYPAAFEKILALETPEGAILCRKALEGIQPVIMRFIKEPKPWGVATSIDVYNCNAVKIRDAQEITRFTHELCELLGMKRFGKTMVVRFGDDPEVTGYSMVQLIETSLVSGHFAEKTNAAYIDIFSCKPYDPDAMRKFTQEFFEGEYSNIGVRKRR